MSQFTIPAGTRLDVATASELEKVLNGQPVNWREHVTRVELSFERDERTRNTGCFFFLHGDWLIRVGRGQTKTPTHTPERLDFSNPYKSDVSI